jgi:hypothetical protein
LDEWLPERHLARFVSELVEEALDLSAIRAAYTEERGYPPYDPRLMLKLLIYGYCTGQPSSRGIERRCQDDVGFRYLAAGAIPDYRRRHQQALAGLFLQALRLCQRAGMVRLGKPCSSSALPFRCESAEEETRAVVRHFDGQDINLAGFSCRHQSTSILLTLDEQWGSPP